MNNRLPPNPAAFASTRQWITAFYEYLVSQTNVGSPIEPQPILMPRLKTDDRAAIDGLLMYDALSSRPVYSVSGAWASLVGQQGPTGPRGPQGLQGPAGSSATLPVGTVAWHALSTAPSGWLICDGSEVDGTYPILRQALIDDGSNYGTANGNPLLPDLRGEFVRGADAGRGVDAGRVFGSTQLDQMQLITGSFRIHGDAGTPVTGAFSNITRNINTNTWGSGGGDTDEISFSSANSPNARTSATTAGETRPRNIAMHGIIKADDLPIRNVFTDAFTEAFV